MRSSRWSGVKLALAIHSFCIQNRRACPAIFFTRAARDATAAEILFTRPVAFVLSGLMAFAYFIAHAPRDFYPIVNAGELAALYCFVFLYFAAAGGGAWSVDAMRKSA